jgi:hypothetical protein
MEENAPRGFKGYPKDGTVGRFHGGYGHFGVLAVLMVLFWGSYELW